MRPTDLRLALVLLVEKLAAIADATTRDQELERFVVRWDSFYALATDLDAMIQAAVALQRWVNQRPKSRK
jgi:hypothetical protein